MEYFIIENGKQAGPFSAKELIDNKHITSETLVWANGLADWTPAWKVEELKVLFEEAKAQTIKQCAGKYVLVYEGALLEGWDGWALRVAEETGVNAFLEAAENAFGVVALGSCAVNGGWMGSKKTPAGAIGCQALMAKHGITTPVINIPGCPARHCAIVGI